MTLMYSFPGDNGLVGLGRARVRMTDVGMNIKKIIREPRRVKIPVFLR